MDTIFEDLTKKKGKPKPTVFTHSLYIDGSWIETKSEPKNYQKVVYVGNDIFAAYHNEVLVIFRGVKGDEF